MPLERSAPTSSAPAPLRGYTYVKEANKTLQRACPPKSSGYKNPPLVMLQSCPELPVYPQKSQLSASDWKINSLAHKNYRPIVTPGMGKCCADPTTACRPRARLCPGILSSRERSGSWGEVLGGNGDFKSGSLERCFKN